MSASRYQLSAKLDGETAAQLLHLQALLGADSLTETVKHAINATFHRHMPSNPELEQK